MVTTIMATSPVGVRDLKRQVASLVRQASRGERVVITRYGKPCALLGPIEPDRGSVPRTGRMAAWQVEREAFERLLPRLARKYAGRHVAVHRGRVVDSDQDSERLYERVSSKLAGATFFIGRVGGPPPVLDMPGFEIE